MVPLIRSEEVYVWSARVHGWTYNPWTAKPDLTAVWLDPKT